MATGRINQVAMLIIIVYSTTLVETSTSFRDKQNAPKPYRVHKHIFSYNTLK